MNIKQIRELAEIVRENGLTALEIEEGETRIFLGRETIVQGAPAVAAAAPVAQQTAPTPAGKEDPVDFNRTKEVKSSLIGVFYASPSPEAQPFVQVGSKVKKGDVLCIIEAMKLMNEIVADEAGEIVDICVSNGDVVEFGQTLFKLC